MMAMAAPASRPGRGFPRFLVWFGILAAPAAWAAQGLLGWFVEGAACSSAYVAISPPAARAVEWTIGLAASIVALAGLAVGISLWRRSRDPRLTALQVERVPDFMAATALLVSLVFLLAIGWASLPSALLRVCENVR